MKAEVITLLATIFTASAAMADCRTIGFKFYPAQNDSISTTGVTTGGSECRHRFRSLATLQMTSGSIVSRPSNGTLTEIGALQFSYVPRAGYKGTDQYTVRVCGRGGGGHGCSTITYNIAVQ